MSIEFHEQLVWALRGLQRQAEIRGYTATADQLKRARLAAEEDRLAGRTAYQAMARLRDLKAGGILEEKRPA